MIPSSLIRIRRSPVAFFVALLVGHGLSAQSVTPGPSTLRGELVRFPDARVNVSVFGPDSQSLPPSLWQRIGRAGNIAFLGQGPLAVNEAVREHTATLAGARSVRIVATPSELDPVGVHVTEAGQVRLAWYGRTEDEGVAILAEARAADDQFTLRILIPNPTDTEDWWGLQAALSQVGIRRVQILSGDP